MTRHIILHPGGWGGGGEGGEGGGNLSMDFKFSIDTSSLPESVAT